ncbi:MAG: hypothetical protein HN564_08550 [Flavobacteriales bacterium]|jgi:hypothetical protein|nr:hypothetical protein [Pelagibacterales bacterium]MBT7897038.1 hypothetical protein [Flavobacteriales bacterium]
MNEKKGLKKLFDFLNSRLIIDKAVDFFLIFIGLLAALSVENYIENQNQEKKYISSLISLHSELETNLLLNDGNNEIKLKYIKIWEDVGEFASNNDFQSYSGLKNIYESKPLEYENKTYLSLDQNAFINRDLLSDIIHMYEINKEVSNSIQDLTISLENLYKMYSELRFIVLYANSEDIINPYSNFNFNFNSFEKLLFIKVEPELKDLEVTGKRILTSIEHELERYNIDIDESKSYSNYYWLANTSYKLKKNDLSIEFAKKGLKKIKNTISSMGNDQKSYYGRLHMHLVENYWILYDNSDSLDFNSFDSLIYNSLLEWEKSNTYNFSCEINYIHYYYENKNYEKFKFHLKEYYLKYSDEKHILNYLQFWQDYIRKEEILNIILEKNPEWTKEYFLNNILQSTTINDRIKKNN